MNKKTVIKNINRNQYDRNQELNSRYRKRVGRRSQKIRLFIISVASLIFICAFAISIMVLWYNSISESGSAADVQVANINIELSGDVKEHVQQILALKNEQNETQVYKIVENAEKYPPKVLEMVSKCPQTIPYAAAYLDKMQERVNNPVIDISNDMGGQAIPLFIQWDDRWGYYDYGNSQIGISGCGATVLSMVIVGLTGNANANPKEVADFSMRNGYVTPDSSTQWTLFTEGAAQYGLHCLHMPMSRENIVESLQKGHPIIASMTPGDFTTGGHFIVLVGLTNDGQVIVNDPNSLENSRKTWSIEQILSQSKGMWRFSTGTDFD